MGSQRASLVLIPGLLCDTLLWQFQIAGLAELADQRLELKGASPFIEYQRRVPFAAPGRGDNRFTFGLMMALCAHCGMD